MSCSRSLGVGLLALCVLATVSCNSSQLAISGNVTVDGKPLEEGTIHFQSSDGTAMRGVGAAVQGGAFKLPTGRRLSPGRYSVSVSGFRKTGKMVSDPQRGKVAEIIPLSFTNSPQALEVSSENSHHIQIELKTSA